jgi:HlyD family secretion protein
VTVAIALRRVLIAAVLVAIAVASWIATRPEPLAVLVATVEPGRVETTVANTRAGSVSACRRAKLAPPLGGRIEKLAAKAGDRVKTGQILLELWNEDLVARELVANESLLTAHTHVREVCALAEIAIRAAARARQLRDKGFVSEESVDRAENEAKAKRAACESTRAQVSEAEARLQASRADTTRTVLRAPFDGIVAEVNGEVGEYLTPSPPGIPTLPAIDLIDDSCLYVTAPIDEVDGARLRVGMAARITLDAYRGTHFAGRVRRIAPYVLAVEKQARTVEVEVAFDQPGAARHLLVGYSADVEIIIEAHDDVLRIPSSALLPANRVLRLGADQRLEARTIETGLSNWEYAEVTAGLARGDRIVISLARAGVEDGARVVVERGVEAAPPAR